MTEKITRRKVEQTREELDFRPDQAALSDDFWKGLKDEERLRRGLKEVKKFEEYLDKNDPRK